MIGLLSSDIDTSRKGLKLEQKIKDYQDSFTAIEKCRKPVIAAIHGGCIGAGIDMTSACDIRYCTEDAFFTIKVCVFQSKEIFMFLFLIFLDRKWILE